MTVARIFAMKAAQRATAIMVPAQVCRACVTARVMALQVSQAADPLSLTSQRHISHPPPAMTCLRIS